MIELDGLTKQFDGFTAVDGVTLSVAPGEILALLGHNGAGKTTTVRMLAAILRPTAGQAFVAGHNVAEQPGEVRRQVGLLTEHPGLYLRMRGREYLDFFGRLMGVDASERERRARELLERFGMLGGMWEFPGGKRRPGEALPACLRREISEELAIEIQVGELLFQVEHAFTHFQMTLYAFDCQWLSGKPQCLGCKDLRWVTLDELDAFAFPVADQKIIAFLRSQKT